MNGNEYLVQRVCWMLVVRVMVVGSDYHAMSAKIKTKVDGSMTEMMAKGSK